MIVLLVKTWQIVQMWCQEMASFFTYNLGLLGAVDLLRIINDMKNSSLSKDYCSWDCIFHESAFCGRPSWGCFWKICCKYHKQFWSVFCHRNSHLWTLQILWPNLTTTSHLGVVFCQRECLERVKIALSHALPCIGVWYGALETFQVGSLTLEPAL